MIKSTLKIVLVILLFSITSKSKDISANNPLIQYYGRVNENHEFDWPGIYIKASFIGSSISAKFTGICRYNVFIDNVQQNELIISSSGTYPIASNLESGEHTILITKRNETNWSKAQFQGFVIDDNASLVDPGLRPTHKIEYIGDSFMVGYGNEHHSNSTGGNTEYVEKTNTYLGFPSVSARTLGVEYQINAYSGLGVINDCNGSTTNILPNFYNYTLQSSKSGSWNFSSWIPDIVVIGLGINDFNGGASAADYEAAYHNFINRIRTNYNNHPYFIILTTSVYQHPEALTSGEAIVSKQQADGHKVFLFNYEYNDLGFSSWSALHWHPYIDEHAAIGNALAARINEIIASEGWPINTSIFQFDSTLKSKLSNKVKLNYLDSGNIGFTLKDAGKYSIKLYTLNGKDVASINTTFYSSGFHNITWKNKIKAGNLYVVVLTHKNESISFKTVVK